MIHQFPMHVYCVDSLDPQTPLTFPHVLWFTMHDDTATTIRLRIYLETTHTRDNIISAHTDLLQKGYALIGITGYIICGQNICDPKS